MLTFTKNASLFRLCSVVHSSHKAFAPENKVNKVFSSYIAKTRHFRLDSSIECLSNCCFLNYCLHLDFRKVKFKSDSRLGLHMYSEKPEDIQYLRNGNFLNTFPTV